MFIFQVVSNLKVLNNVTYKYETNKNFMESLILAQDERWRYA